MILEWIDIHSVGFGECIVLGGKSELLMVDCGSMNTVIKAQNITFKNYVKKQIIPRYFDVNNKSFLLTHFHKDHINGFKHILNSEPSYFDKIYIPKMPMGESGKAPLLELAVFSFVFLNKKTNCAQMNTALMFIFNLIQKSMGVSEIVTLKMGDVFEALGCRYEVLSPNDRQIFSTIILDSVEKVNEILRSHSQNLSVKNLIDIKEKFCHTYLECSEMCWIQNRAPKDELLKKVEDLKSFIKILSSISKELFGTQVECEVSGVLTCEEVQNEYSIVQNEFSVVFQNKVCSDRNIIMTGDATENAIFKISQKLFSRYHVFKAPHHGTEGNYCKIFDNILKEHVIISNGDYHAGGKISPKYCGSLSINHCTDNTGCKFFNENKSCCNRLCYCCDFSEDLSLRCKYNGMNSGVSPCNIYVVSSWNDRGCFCDT